MLPFRYNPVLCAQITVSITALIAHSLTRGSIWQLIQLSGSCLADQTKIGTNQYKGAMLLGEFYSDRIALVLNKTVT